MVGEFALMLLHVCEGAVEPLLFSSEKHESNRASGFHPRTHDRIGGSEHAGGAGPIVCASFGEIPRIQMCADNQDLLGIFATANFTHHVGALDWSIRKRILDIETRARSDTPIYVAFELALIFGGHGHHRDGEIRVKAENSGVRQIHSAGFSAALTTDYNQHARFCCRTQKIAETRESIPTSSRIAFCHDQRDFAFQPSDFFHFVIEVEHIRGDDFAFDATSGRRAGPAHGIDVQFVADGSDYLGIGGAAPPAAPELPFFGVHIFQADSTHLCYAPVDCFLRFGGSGYAGADVIA